MASGNTQVVRVLNVSQMARGLPLQFNALPGMVGTPGPQGPPGAGSFTTVLNPFTVPLVNGSVNMTLNNTQWMLAGQTVYVQGAGYYTVQSVADINHATLINTGAPGNVSPGTIVSSPTGITSAGGQGAQGSQGVQGPVGPAGPVGPQGTGITYRQTWSATTAYAINDAVTYGGSSYVALKASTGVIPGTDPTTWGVFAAQGVTGATGAPGAQGPTGATGAIGPPGPASTAFTTAAFTQPAVNGSVTVPVTQTSWCPAGSVVFIAGGGYYEVISVPDGTHLNLQNPGWPDAATPGSTVPTNSLVSAGGVEGAPGTPGAPGPVGPQGATGTPGAHAYSILQSSFVVPAPGSAVSLTVDVTAWMTTNLPIYINGAGYYQITSVGGANLIQAINLGYQGNATPNTTIASGSYVYAAGAPQQVNRSYFETDFDTGWADWTVTSGQMLKMGQVDADNQGIVSLSATGPASGNTYGLQSGAGAGPNQVGSRTAYFHARGQVPTLSTATDSFNFFFGWFDNPPSGTFQNGVFFYYTNGGSTPGNWGCYCRRAGAQVYTDSGVTLKTGWWYDLEVTIDGVYATFSIASYPTGTPPTAPVMVAQTAISQCPAAGQGLGAHFGGQKLSGSTVTPQFWLDMYEHEIIYQGIPKFRRPAMIGPAGKNSTTGTTAPITLPNTGQNVTVTVADTTFMAPGMQLFVQGAGTYQVSSVQDPTHVVLTNTGATGNTAPGTVVNAGAGVTVSGVPGPAGIQGPLGPPGPVGQGAFTTLTNSFIQPVTNGTVNVPVIDSDWMAVGMTIYIQSGGYYVVQSVPNKQNITVINPGYTGNSAPGSTVLNNSQVSAGGIVGPAGVDPAIVGSIMQWCGPGLPQGWLTADGSPVSRTTYPQLYTALGAQGSPWGQGDGATTFNLPDLRGRTLVGVGQGPGLSNRTLAASGGEESHVLTQGEMPIHSHGVSFVDPGHNHPYHDPGHVHSQTPHGHTASDSGHTHSAGIAFFGSGPVGGTSGSYNFGAINTGVGYANITVNAAYANINAATSGTWMDAAGTGISISIQNSVGGGAHNNMPPWLAVYYIIKASYNVPMGANVPLADSTQNGLLRQVSGLITDYVGGDNTCHDLATAVRTYAPAIRSFNALGNSTFELDSRTCGTGTSSNAFALDRWQLQKAGTGVLSAVQTAATSPIVVAGTTFGVTSKFLRLTITTQQGTLGTGDYFMVMQSVEGSRLRELLSGPSSVGILIRSSIGSMNFSIALRDVNNAWSCVQLGTLTNPNAWTLVPLNNFPLWNGSFGFTPGTLGCTFQLTLGAGSTYIASGTNNWLNANVLAAPGQNNFMANAVGSTVDLAFAQLEPGTSFSGPIDLDLEANLRSCKRYYQKSNAITTRFPTANDWVQIGQWLNGNSYSRSMVRFEVEMAKPPNMRIAGVDGTLNQIYIDGIGTAAPISGVVGATTRGFQQISTPTAYSPGFTPVLAQWEADTNW